MPTIGELFPRFCVELQDLASSAGRPDLAGQIPTLPIVGRCTCGESNCAHFYTAPPPTAAYGPGHSCLALEPDCGLLVLDLVNDAIVAVEVLDRPDVKSLLDAALPLANTKRSTGLGGLLALLALLAGCTQPPDRVFVPGPPFTQFSTQVVGDRDAIPVVEPKDRCASGCCLTSRCTRTDALVAALPLASAAGRRYR